MTQTQSTPPDLSIVVVTWNSLELTSAALRSIAEHASGITYEVFVIDNGTTRDQSRTELPRRHPWVKFIWNDANLGFSKANNAALRQARGRYRLLLNNDTVQTHNALGDVVRYMDANPDIGAVGILHRNDDADRSIQPSFFSFPNPWNDIRGLVGLPSYREPVWSTDLVPGERDVPWIVGSFLCMRSETIDAVGLLDERFFIYDEDIDWCKRAWAAGWRIRFYPGASMIHVGASARPFMKDKTFIHFRSHLSYIAKHHSALAAVGYYAAMTTRLTLATARQLARFAVGRASRADLSDRFRRQRQFLMMRSGRVGG